MYCKFEKECSFYGATHCKDNQWKDPEECTMYQLIKDNKKDANDLLKILTHVNKGLIKG